MNLRLTVVSHACVLATNQAVYTHLAPSCDVTLVVPAQWRDELRASRYAPQRHDAFTGEIVPVRTWGLGRPQRHVPVVRPVAFLRRRRPDVLIIEEEPFSAAAAIWSGAARRCRVPYAVQVAENQGRQFPRAVQHSCGRVLAECSFVLARSPAALARAREWGYLGPATVVPHGVELTTAVPRSYPARVVGFVGRLVTAKGVDDLAAALDRDPSLQLRVAGDGPQRSVLAALGDRVHFSGTLSSGAMDGFYDEISVLAVPSRTTPTWSEQFGRVIVEAQARATPVVAYDSGEIPWVASLTAAITVNEGDTAELARQLARYAHDPDAARDLGERGRQGVDATFSNAAIAAQLRSLLTSATAPR